MILLSEITNRISREIRSWPSRQNLKVEILIDPEVKDIRDGDEGIFTELLMMPVGLLPESVSRIDIQITGNDDSVCIYYNFDSPSTQSIPLWKNLTDKAAAWNPQIHIGDRGVDITLNLSASEIYPPVDLRAMAKETGIELEDAGIIFEGFIEKARIYIKILNEGIEKHGKEACFRAAHSLKGAGKTLRAPELTAAAGVLEQKIREDAASENDQRRLESVWDRIELWFKGNKHEREINPLR